MQEVASAAGGPEYGALAGLVQAAGAIVSAALAIGVTWKRGGTFVPAQEDLPKAAERVGGLLTAVVLAIVWAQYNAHAHVPRLISLALWTVVSALVAFFVYAFLVSLQTYQKEDPTTTPRLVKIVGGFRLTESARKAVRRGSDVQTVFKEFSYNLDRTWTRKSRALAQGTFALFFVLLTSSGTIALSAAAMVFLIKQTPSPKPTPLPGLSLIILEAPSTTFAGIQPHDSNAANAKVRSYQVILGSALIGKVAFSDVRTGGRFDFNSYAGRTNVVVTNDAGTSWTCPLTLVEGVKTYGITAAASDTACTASEISPKVFDDFVARITDVSATLTLTFEGEIEVLRRQKVPQPATTPNNDGNRGDCERKVGYRDGFCMSRTTAALTTQAPFVWKDASVVCQGKGCDWATVGPVSISEDRLTASAYLDNWGSTVTLVLTADEYERVTAASCGNNVTASASRTQVARFRVPKKCEPISTVKWSLPDGRTGEFAVTRKGSPQGEIIVDGEPEDRGSEVVYAFRRASGDAATVSSR